MKLIRHGDADGLFIVIILAIFVLSPVIVAGGLLVRDYYKEEQKIQREKEIFVIEGVVKKAENFKGDKDNPDRVTITFSDGRNKTLKGVPSKPFMEGKYYIIRYDGTERIVTMEEK